MLSLQETFHAKMFIPRSAACFGCSLNPAPDKAPIGGLGVTTHQPQMNVFLVYSIPPPGLGAFCWIGTNNACSPGGGRYCPQILLSRILPSQYHLYPFEALGGRSTARCPAFITTCVGLLHVPGARWRFGIEPGSLDRCQVTTWVG